MSLIHHAWQFNNEEKSQPKVNNEHSKITSMKKSLMSLLLIYVVLYNLKNVKNAHGGVLILVNLQAAACNFTKINIPPRVFFTLFKLYKCYQIAQRTTYIM